MLVIDDFDVHIEELGSRTNNNAPPAPAPLSYAEVATPPPQPTFPPPPFVVPPRPVHPVYTTRSVLTQDPGVYPTTAWSTTSVVSLVMWCGFATIAWGFTLITNLSDPTVLRLRPSRC
ncbi:hypothetical protein HPB50_027851 [Hyalomma asiaticum]|nr:hypothetical protein HPB50_027851 [Hyalomma asiaticum]